MSFVTMVNNRMVLNVPSISVYVKKLSERYKHVCMRSIHQAAMLSRQQYSFFIFLLLKEVIWSLVLC